MKILQLMPYVPVPPDFGGALRIYHIVNHIRKYHDLTVAGFCDMGNTSAFKNQFMLQDDKIHLVNRKLLHRYPRLYQAFSLINGHSYQYNRMISRDFQNNLDELFDKQTFDLVQIEFASMGKFNIRSDALKVLDAHNVEYDNYRRMAERINHSSIRKYFYQNEYKKFYREEIKVWNRQDGIFATSYRDRDIIENEVPGIPKFVIPNGVDMEYFKPSVVNPEPHSLVFTGMMGYIPNYDAMYFFLDEIYPLIRQQIPDIKLYIVGKNPPVDLRKRANQNIVITGLVEDVRPFVYRSTVYVVPLRMGGGTRLKILEALSMKKPLVTTSIGCEGIDVVHNESAMIADEPEEFAETVIGLIKDKKRQTLLQRNGYDLVREKYDWNVIGNLLEDAYDSLFQHHYQKKEMKYFSQ
jgi:glycosyltransferase involved in cell wall biosynthesis